MHPSKTFSEVINPTLVDRGGSALFCGTPNGKNQFYDIAQFAQVEEAKGNPEWFFRQYPASQTGLLDSAYLKEARGVMTEDEYQQEFECSFDAPNSGSYYAKWLDAALKDDRIRRVTYDPKLPVYTCWDLGMDDSTAIWWFQRSPGGEWRWLEYHEDSGPGLDHYARIVLNKPYAYGKHYLPHDVEGLLLGHP